MFRRILIPTDFSTASEWIIDDALRIAGTNRAELLILHVRMTWASHPDELRFPADPSLYEYAEKLELERLRDRVRRANADVVTRMIVRQAPKAGQEICRTAKDEQADLIVIATHARHHVAHLLIGSTTLSVVKDPPAPVLAIRYGIRKRGDIRRIVVPVHLKQTRHAALERAVAVASEENGEVHLLTVCRDDEHPEAERLLAELAAPHANVARQVVVKGTDVGKEILRYTDKSESDAIFLNAAHELSPGKVDIVRHATTPVMIVP